MAPVPYPKPSKVVRERRPMKRTQGLKNRKPMRRVGKKGAAFPKVKNREFRTWLRTEHDCEIRGRFLLAPLSFMDVPAARGPWDPKVKFLHRCWLPIDPAHVGLKQSQGAPDVGHCVPLCRAAHRFYDNHRADWEAATGLSEAEMERRAGGYGLKWVERGGDYLKSQRGA